MEEESMLKRLYHGIEDSYYGLCDFLQQDLKIPIYDVFVTPVEKKGIPSLPVFLLLTLLLIGGGIFTYMSYTKGTAIAKVYVMQDGIALSGVPVRLEYNGIEFKTVKSDANGLALFEGIPIGVNAKININRDGFEPFTKELSIANPTESLTASLQQTGENPDIQPNEKVRIVLKVFDSDDLPLGDAGISVRDSYNGNVDVLSTDGSGSANLLAESIDSELSVKVTKRGYDTATLIIIAATDRTKKVTLQKERPNPTDEPAPIDQGTVLVTVKNSAGDPIDAIISLYKFATKTLLDSGRSGEEGKVKFTDINAIGSKVFVVAQPRDGAYLIYDGANDAQVLSAVEELEFAITLEDAEIGTDYNNTIIVKEKGADTIVGARVKWYTLDSKSPLKSEETNSEGRASIQTDKAIYATIFMEGYLPQIELDLIAGTPKTVELEPITEDNSGNVKATILDFEGNLVQGAKVNLYTEDGFFTGIEEEISLEDGTATMKDVPIELMGSEARYIARASKGSVDGASAVFVVDAAQTKEISLRLSQPKGSAILKIKDATNQKPIGTGKATAYLRSDDSKVGECNILQSTCNLEIPAGQKIYFKITSDNYLDLETEEFSLEPEEEKILEASFFPEALKNQLTVIFDGISNYGDTYSRDIASLAKGNFYYARFILNIPANSDKAGMLLKVSGNDAVLADDDFVAIADFDKADDSIITKGFSYKPSGDCKADFASKDESSNKFAKWVNVEYAKSEGTKAVRLKIFVKPKATIDNEFSIEYSAYASKGKVFSHIPEDSELEWNEKIAGKDSCYAAKNGTKFKIIEDRFTCNDKACIMLAFSKTQAATLSKTFSAEVGEKFIVHARVRALEPLGNGPYLRLTDDLEIKFLGSGDGTTEHEFDIQDLAPGGEIHATVESMGLLPSGFSKINLELGNENGKIISAKTTIVITGKNEFKMQIAPRELQANSDAKLVVNLVSAIDQEPVMDATVSIEEGDSAEFDGSTPDTIVGSGEENYGADGKYVFRKVHPFNTGEFKVVAKRKGYKDSVGYVKVDLLDFMESSKQSFSFQCEADYVTLSNLLNAKISILAKSPCVEIFGEGVNKVGDSGSDYTFSINQKQGDSTEKRLTLTPTRIAKDCTITFNGFVGSAHNIIEIPTKVKCDKLDRLCDTKSDCLDSEKCNTKGICANEISCIDDADCNPGFVCKSQICKQIYNISRLPTDRIDIVLDENHLYSQKFNVESLVGSDSKILGCEVKSSESQTSLRMDNFVTPDCIAYASENQIEITADYSTHPYYNGDSPNFQGATSGNLKSLQSGTLYVTLENKPKVTPKIYVSGPVCTYDGCVYVPPVWNPNSLCAEQNAIAYKCDNGNFMRTFTLPIVGAGSDYYNESGTLIEKCPQNPTAMNEKCKTLTALNCQTPVCGTPYVPPAVSFSGIEVDITSRGFEPNQIKIEEGEAITWFNMDDVAHNVQSISDSGASEGLSSGSIKPGGNFTFNFTKAGVYNYRDTSRTMVKGVVYVGDLDAVCKYKNKNYFAQRFVGYLTKSIATFFEPSAGKKQQVAYSSVYKFYVQPSGIESVAQSGLAPQEIYGYNSNAMTQQWDPRDPRIGQLYQQRFMQNGYTTLSGAEDNGMCVEDGNAGFKCKVHISPLFPVNGVAFSIINDYALLGGSPKNILVDGTDKEKTNYLKGIYADRSGPDGFIIGKLSNIAEIFGQAPRYSTFIITNDPQKMKYAYDDVEKRIELQFADGTNDEKLQTLDMSFGGPSGQKFSIKITFVIDNAIGKYAISRTPITNTINARDTTILTALEPGYFVNNIPSSQLTSEISLVPAGKAFPRLYYSDLELPTTPTTKDLSLIRGKEITPIKLELMLPEGSIVTEKSSFDVIGNIGTDKSYADLGLECAGGNYCKKEEFDIAVKKVEKEIDDEFGKIQVQRLDFAGFGSYAADRITDAALQTLKEYAADKIQYKLCGGVDGIRNGICGNDAQGSYDMSCFGENTYCDSSISYGELRDVAKEQLNYVACDSAFLNQFENFANANDWNGARAMMYGNIMGRSEYQPRIQYTKPIIKSNNLLLGVLFKRTAEEGNAGGIIYKDFVGKVADDSNSDDGYLTLDQILTAESAATARDEAISEATGSAPKTKTTGIGAFLGVIHENDAPTRYEYIDNTANKIIVSTEPTLFTMNKYPFNFDGDKLKIIKDDDRFKEHIILAPKDPNAIKVVSCKVGFERLINAQSNPFAITASIEGITDNPCGPDLIVKIKQKITDEKIVQPVSYLELNGKTLTIVSASISKDKTCTGGTFMANCIPSGTPLSFEDASTTTLKKALTFLLDETKTGNDVYSAPGIKQEPKYWSFGFEQKQGTPTTIPAPVIPE